MLDWVGSELASEIGGSNARRYIHGPAMDEPLVWYEGSGTSNRRWFHADERGSTIAVSDSSGNLVGTRNRYDEYGVPQGTLTGRFGYTGQAFLPEIGMYYYRARIYNQSLGRFMQTDPLGSRGGMNLYAYVGNDPVNFSDPLGLKKVCVQEPGSRISRCWDEKDEDRDGDIDAEDRRITESIMLFIFANPDMFVSNSQEMMDLDRLISDSQGLGYQLASTQGPFTPIPRNDNETRYELCRMGHRQCRAQARMQAPPGTLADWLEGCMASYNFCRETADNPLIRTRGIVHFPNGAMIIFGPGGRSVYIPPPPPRR